MPSGFIQEIVSGGQTGVDRAALDIAIQFKIPHSGWCPYGREAEDGVIPMKYTLKEAPAPTTNLNLEPDAIYKIRTEFNVRDSDGTLVIVKGDPIGGTLFTIEMAKQHNKPYLVFNLSNNSHTVSDIVDWVLKYSIRKLNVAGPRASITSGIYKMAHTILLQFLEK